jgi:hypothetical protein
MDNFKTAHFVTGMAGTLIPSLTVTEETEDFISHDILQKW